MLQKHKKYLVFNGSNFQLYFNLLIERDIVKLYFKIRLWISAKIIAIFNKIETF